MLRYTFPKGSWSCIGLNLEELRAVIFLLRGIAAVDGRGEVLIRGVLIVLGVLLA